MLWVEPCPTATSAKGSDQEDQANACQHAASKAYGDDHHRARAEGAISRDWRAHALNEACRSGGNQRRPRGRQIAVDSLNNLGALRDLMFVSLISQPQR